MRTLNVCLLASSISFNALAADISGVVAGYDGQQPIHRYLKNTEINTAIAAIPSLAMNQSDDILEKIKLETVLLANSKKIKITELNEILNRVHDSVPVDMQRFYKTEIKPQGYTSLQNERYRFETHVSEDNTISCILRNLDTEKSTIIKDYAFSSSDKNASIEGNNFDDETAYFAERSILKEAAKICKHENIIDFSKGVNNANTIIAVDFSPEATEVQKNTVYDILLHYTMPGILNKVNIENFKDILTDDLFDKFISQKHFLDLTSKIEEIKTIYDKLQKNNKQLYSYERGEMIKLLTDKYLVLYNNHIISAYLHAYGCVNKVLFVPKTLYQMAVLEGLSHNDIYQKYDICVDDISFHPSFHNINDLKKSYDESYYTKYIALISLANSNVLKYTQNIGLESAIYKIVSKMKKARYICNNIECARNCWNMILRNSGFSRLIFSYSSQYTSLNFYKMISNIIKQEYEALQHTWRVYHGGNKCRITNDFSSSFSDGLFSGSIHDASGGCAAHYAFTRGLFYCDITLSMPNTNFYLPAVHTTLPMFGVGEIHHVRTKVYTNEKQYKSYQDILGYMFNCEEESEEIITSNYPMLFFQDSKEFQDVAVYHVADIKTKVRNYVEKVAIKN